MKGFLSWAKRINGAELVRDCALLSGLIVLVSTGTVGTIMAGATLVYLGLFHGRLVK